MNGSKTCNVKPKIQFNISDLFAHSWMVSSLESDYIFLSFLKTLELESHHQKI